MGKATGFIEWERLLPRKRGVDERLGSFREFTRSAPAEQIRQQAGRCMDCGVPFCMQGCPLGNPIPDFNDGVYRGRFRQAYLQLSSTNNFPEFTGRLCPAPCEGACTLAINGEAVTIEELEKTIIERAFVEGWVTPQPPPFRSGQTVAIVGSGPAGLAAAAQLNRAGHRVTVYERDDRIGGLLRYGIPDFKMEKHIIDRRVAIMEHEGVRFEPGADVGLSPPWDQLAAQHDAVLIAVGSRRPRDLAVPGRDLEGVVFAMDFLEQQNRVVAGEGVPNQIHAAGKRVVILGGGDTGSDCLGTCHRQGAASVMQIELFPSPPQERGPTNPWPQWPLIFRSSSSQEEGGVREFALMTERLSGDGHIEQLHAVRVATNGGLERIAGTETTVALDLLILAMGFVGPETASLTKQLGVALDGRGNVACDGYLTSVPSIFAAGDARRGQSLIVWAIMEGREAAVAIDSHLRNASSPLPRRGIDLPFGGR